LYGDEFKDYLPYTAFRPRSGPVELPHQIMRRAEEEQRLSSFDGDSADDGSAPHGN